MHIRFHFLAAGLPLRPTGQGRQLAGLLMQSRTEVMVVATRLGFFIVKRRTTLPALIL
jgi:hypothetical protein